MKVYVETYGCASNFNDHEIILGLLVKAGCEITHSLEEADIVILNTCTVKERTVNKMMSRMKALSNKKLIIAGCMPHTDYELIKRFAPHASIISTRCISKIPYVVKATAFGKRIEIIEEKKDCKVCMPKIRRHEIIDTVEICSGCKYACSYCSVKFAKGELFSYPVEKIIKEMKTLSNECKEFWLTGQDVASYCYEGMRLPDLLEEILSKVKGKYYLRLGMMNPASVLEILDELIEVYNEERIFKFLHLPVQSGSNRILKLMNRKYRVEEFVKIIKRFRKSFPKITIWTDIIVGFPHEEESDFNKTLELLKYVKPDYTNISRFSSRRGTQASKMKQVPTEIKKKRSKIATKIVDSITMEKNREWIGWEGEVLIDEPNMGRNFAYKPIAVNGRIGESFQVKIIDAKKTCLIARRV